MHIKMDTNTLIQLATLISVIAAVVGLMISVRAYKRQVSALFLLEYTKRVDDIMRSFPPSLWAPRLFPQELPEPSDELRLSAMRCLNFVSQLHYFSRKGYISRDVWRRGQGIYAEILQSPFFVREWKTVAPRFAADAVFCRFVEKAQQMSEGKPDPAGTHLDKSFEPTE
jgi:hypothetical protein